MFDVSVIAMWLMLGFVIWFWYGISAVGCSFLCTIPAFMSPVLCTSSCSFVAVYVVVLKYITTVKVML